MTPSPPEPASSPAASLGAPPGAGSRLAAAELLVRVIDGKADLDTALREVASFALLEGADRGFARAIASAALRGLGRIDWALGGLIDRPLDKLEPALRALLRTGCAQLWMLGVADHAAVSATVDAARAWSDAQRGQGLVNAVLRRAARERAAFDAAPPTSVWPDWLAAKLKASLGADGADRLAVLQLEEPYLDLTLKTAGEGALWAGRLGGVELANGSIRLSPGAPLSALPGYEEGAWWVQDAAASLAVRLFGDLRGRRAADLCAAPGGKALQMAAAGADLVAVDISRQRLSLLEENAARTRLAMTITEADARLWRPPELLDAVLLDAPCSALGVLRRHPEGAWRRDPADLARFPQIQANLVRAAREMLKPDGVLVYCVCTPNPEEGKEVIAAALAEGGWRPHPIAEGEIPGFGQTLTPEGAVLTAPQERVSDAARARENVAQPVATDVFYVARLARRL